MPDLDKHISIPKNITSGDDLDYSFLRKKGQEYIEQLASDIWTDYNEHDPGITILEMLAYALTDLGARIEMPLENLLAPEDGSTGKIEEQFFNASEILPSNPVSEADYRKLFIDIEGVKNCWLKPYSKTVYVDCKHDKLSYNPDEFNSTHEDFKKDFKLQGLYDVIVDYEDSEKEKCKSEETEEAEGNGHEDINDEIKRRFHSNRNLCEDLVRISKVEKHPVKVCAHIEVEPEADEELVHAKVLNTIDNYFSLSLKFYSLKQLFDKGYTSDEIFEGPVLTSGFLDPKELDEAKLREEVRLSDLMQLIMNVEGVKVIKDISIGDCSTNKEETESWVLCIDDGKKPCRCEESTFSYFKGVLPVNVNEKKVEVYRNEIEQAEKDAQEQAKLDMEIEIPSGVNLGTNETTTIQNDFPETYGIGRVGLPPRADTARKAKAKQLKSYLLFFDQVLANYFAHLGKVKDLLSVSGKTSKTYFAQQVEDIKDFSGLVNHYPADDPEKLTQELLAELDNNIERRNKLLDHLIARFAEKFSEYAFLMKQLYGNYADQAVLNSKENFLTDYNVTSRQRGSAFNYYNQPEENLWDTPNVSGIQKRISRLAGIKNYNRRNLSGSFAEVYELTDSDGNEVHRWRIRDTENEIILSATENYSAKVLAQREMYLAVAKIIQTPLQTIEEAFQNEILDEAEVGNFEIQLSESGKYSFDLINLDAEADSTDRIIARQFSYYDTQDELKQAILDIIRFMRQDFTEEGIFVVEHNLLRPDVTENSAPLDYFLPICTDECTNCEPLDPYSFRITVVLPGWTYRFADRNFRNFLGELIRKEIPAHVLAKVCWIGYPKITDEPEEENDMVHFEKAWREFLFTKTELEQEQDETTLKQLIKILNELNTVYQEGKLLDCDEEDETLEGKIVLGRTNIGNL